MKRVVLITVACMVVLLIGVTMIQFARSYRAMAKPRISLLVPDGFRGVIVLVPASTMSNSLEMGTIVETSGGEFELRVDESGRTVLSDMRILGNLHQLRAITESGGVIEIGIPTESEPSRICLYPLHTMSDGTTRYLIGDLSDYQWCVEHSPRLDPGPISRADQ